MSSATPLPESARHKSARSLGLRILSGAVGALACMAIFYWLPGRHDWLQGWMYLGLVILSHSASALCVWRRNPELLRRRRRVGEGTKTWDKFWLTGMSLLYMAILVVGALDSGRFGWSGMSLWWWPVGAGLYLLSLAGLTWCMTVNPHFEKTVRIQTDRDHRVIDQGPYRCVRHPGYVATIFGFIMGIPLLLGSWWAFLPAVLTALWLVARTVGEDRMLQRELPGYADYAQRVRWRLLPGLW